MSSISNEFISYLNSNYNNEDIDVLDEIENKLHSSKNTKKVRKFSKFVE